MSRYAVCADVGSTWTKVAVVDLTGGTLAGAAARRTTAGSEVAPAGLTPGGVVSGGVVRGDVLRGLDSAVAAAIDGLGADGAHAPRYVCSSAGGGLRLAVLGYERLVTAAAGQRVGLSAGAAVVHVFAGRLDGPAIAALRAARPDVVLLVGGTDGGDGEVLSHNSGRLAATRWRTPVVVAGNIEARADAVHTLAVRGVPVTAADNVLPRLGVLAPGSARAAIREVFLRHVIGGKRLSRGPRFAQLVRGATPDVVLSGLELLADNYPGDLLVVDIGGATTDVYSLLRPPDEGVADAGSADLPGHRRTTSPSSARQRRLADGQPTRAGREVAGQLWRARTVEGDLGMRAGAPGVVAAAVTERLVGDDESAALRAAAATRAAETGLLVTDADGWATELRLAELAATVALRRHARDQPTGEARTGRDLRGVRLVIGSGGVLRHAPRGAGLAALSAAVNDHAGGWPLPRAPRLHIDADYVLAAAGLLAAEHPAPAIALLRHHFGLADLAATAPQVP